MRWKQILEQQLLEKDRVVSVNGKTGVAEMLADLSNASVNCCHIRVRRYSHQHTAHFAVARADVAVATVSSEPRIITHHYTTSSSGSASAPEGSSQFPRARVIETHDSLHEP